MADVFLAVAHGPRGFTKLSVLKVLRHEHEGESDFVSMFLDEARLAARLNHPNVVQTTEVGDEGHRFLVMEYLRGQSLQRLMRWVRREGSNESRLACQLRVLCDALTGLHYAHELCDYDGSPLNVVHRDVSPQNIFVTYDGLAKVVDFGIAKAASTSNETRAGVLKGKIPFMAPEQVRLEKVDRRADVFGVGVMLWEMLAGRALWDGLVDVCIWQRLRDGDIPSLRGVAAGVPECLLRVCERSLSPDRESRYGSAAEMAADLEACLTSLGWPSRTVDVAALMDEAFGAEREALRQCVETALQRAPAPSLVAVPDLTSNLSAAERTISPASDAPVVRSGPVESQRGDVMRGTGTVNAVHSTVITAKLSGRLRGASVVGALALVALSLGVLRRREGVASSGANPHAASFALGASPTSAALTPALTATALASAPPAASAEPAASPAEDEVRIETHLSASPSWARLTLDGHALRGTRFVGELARGNHELRVEAKGFPPVTRTFSVPAPGPIKVTLGSGVVARPAARSAGPRNARPDAGRSPYDEVYVGSTPAAPRLHPVPSVTLDTKPPW
jgi:serine/threonine-protein kinase